MENLEGSSFKRYEKITNVLINELGYKLESEGKNKYGIYTWKFIRDGQNLELDENTIDEYYRTNFESFRLRHEKNMEEAAKVIKKYLDQLKNT